MRAIPFLVLTALAGGCDSQRPPPGPSAPSEASPASPPCVYFKDLRPFLPAALPGYRTSRDEGSTGKYGEVSVSEAERVFTRGEKELVVRIIDTTVAERLGQRIKAASEDSAAPLALEDTVGFVRYDARQAKAEANLLVGSRFVVAVTGHGFEDAAQVSEVARKLDLAGLSKLR